MLSAKVTWTKLNPNMLLPRTLSAPATDCRATDSGYVIWSSMSLGLRPGQSVSTMTWFSLTLGIASMGTLRKEYQPYAMTAAVMMKTTSRSRTQKLTMDLITREPPFVEAPSEEDPFAAGSFGASRRNRRMNPLPLNFLLDHCDSF